MNNIPVKTKIGYQQLFKISLMKEVIKPTKPHKHNDYFEVIILNKGAGFHSIDSVQYEVLPPVVYFLKPGQVHCWNFTKIPKGYVILFREELIRQFNGTKGKLYDLPSQIKLNNEGNLWGLLNQLLAEYKAGPLRHEILRSYLDILLIKIFDGSKDQPKNQRQTPDLIYQFKKLIDARYIHLKQVSEYA